jgi:predicted alpha/beta hydrolase
MLLGRIGASRASTPPPSRTGELITLAARSGQSLAVSIREPRGAVRGTAILLHSMMASRRMWSAPRGRGLEGALVERGLRTLCLDFRGHGDSAPSASQGNRWTYGDLVGEDLPALVESARDRWPNDRMTVIGHSLGGHVAAASAAVSLIDIDALVILATNVWLPSFEPNPFLRAKKGAVVRMSRGITRARGFFPARALRLGSDDESAGMMDAWTGWWKRDVWTSDDSKIDYAPALQKLTVPVLAIASLGDKYLCTPDAALRFAKLAVSSQTEFELVRRADDGGPAPDHMELVTTRAAASIWQRIASFCVDRPS